MEGLQFHNNFRENMRQKKTVFWVENIHGNQYLQN